MADRQWKARHGMELPGNKRRLVNRGCPQGIVELNQSLGRSGSGMSGSDFDPLGAIVWEWV